MQFRLDFALVASLCDKHALHVSSSPVCQSLQSCTEPQRKLFLTVFVVDSLQMRKRYLTILVNYNYFHFLQQLLLQIIVARC